MIKFGVYGDEDKFYIFIKDDDKMTGYVTATKDGQAWKTVNR